ncbi:MAG: esterase-like activity of phytase family protein [Cytophagales bacterium]|nr:esterase-like activity of phytase family protein [Armatimonadota bacterium]
MPTSSLLPKGSRRLVLTARASLLTLALTLPLVAQTARTAQAQTTPILVTTLALPGNTLDRTVSPTDAGDNRFGFFSDLHYDRANNVYYALGDRGPGGGVLNYETRVQKFTVDVNSVTGAISSFAVTDTIRFKDASGNAFNGLNPQILNGSSANLGSSLDPEGFVVGANGNFFVSDEYGPSVYEFTATGAYVRAFIPPPNLVPQNAGGPNYVEGRPVITSGRQDNRGFEGLTISPDGKTLYAILQDPLVNEGSQNDGRRSTNLRIIAYDVETGNQKSQYVYQLESIATINDRIPGTSNDFSATNQGRSIGVSSITAISDTKFLVIERDNRGLGVDNPLATTDPASANVGTKRIYLIDISGATDVKEISLANTNTLPVGVTAVQKQLYLDVQAALVQAGLIIPEKLEGLAIGPQLADGTFAILLGTDNDFSVTQSGTGTQFDVYTNQNGGTVQVPIGTTAGVPAGYTLIPGYLYSFKADINAVAAPEPGTLALALAGGLPLAGLAVRRRRRGAATGKIR